MLAELMRFQQGIAVAGTHGKTTTTQPRGQRAGRGRPRSHLRDRRAAQLPSAPTRGWARASSWSPKPTNPTPRSCYLQPVIAVVTNIDADHLENYGQDFAQLKAAFVEFLQRLPFYGLAVLCMDDPNVRAIMPAITRADAHLRHRARRRPARRGRAQRRRAHALRACSCPTACAPLESLLNLPGEHNVLNALAAIAVAARGRRRRTRRSPRRWPNSRGVGPALPALGDIALGRRRHVQLVDDYGHHPAELAAVFAAARGGCPDRRLVLAFQPHRYTRTRDLLRRFRAACSRRSTCWC